MGMHSLVPGKGWGTLTKLSSSRVVIENSWKERWGRINLKFLKEKLATAIYLP